LGLDLRILGPLEASRDGEPLRLGGRKPRLLLALLIVAGGEAVSPDRLIEALWPEYDPGATARLQVMVSQLRKALGDPGAIAMRAGGYVLNADTVDAAYFERLARDGRGALADGDAEGAAATLAEALAVWRGPVLGDIGSEPFARAEAGRLEELRLGAVEDRVDAELALGHERDVLADVEALVRLHPLRERLRGALMLALYRAGRQADALAAFLAARRTLVDELGVEPGPALRDLHAAILNHDPALVVERPELRARRHLPAPATPLVGRREQLDELIELMSRVRLATLTGPGGTGKTRLAIQAGVELAERFDDGVYFVGLAEVEDPALVPYAIADALEVEEHPDRAMTETLARRLEDRRLLLVLDNFEHVDDAAPVVSGLLLAAPDLKVLATSRAPLRLYGEHEYPVPPLADAEAVDLFVARAQAARHAFVAHDAVVGEICARLDGLPLAIELVAARSRTLALDEMLAGLSQRLRLAAQGPRDLPERQRALRAALDWSYRLLDERARDVFTRLGVFVGGWDAAAARVVCGARREELDALADQSLLHRAGHRYDMLETVREYALDRLAAAGDEDRLRGLHAAHFTAFAQAVDAELTSDPKATWLGRVDAEHANLRAAIAWAGRARDHELELRLVAALARYWRIRGHMREARAWLDGALARSDHQAPRAHAGALAAAAAVALSQGDYEAMQRFAADALALCEELGDTRGMAEALDRIATAVANQGDLERSTELYERSLALWREVGDERGLGVSTTNVGCLALMQGDLERAIAFSREGLALYERAGQRDLMLHPMFNLGLAELLQGRHADALASFGNGLEIAFELDYRESIALNLEGIAAVHAATGDPERAARLLGAAEEVADQAGFRREPLEQQVHDRTVAAVRAALGDDGLAAAIAEGRTLAPADALAAV
jgi:predicted ATPase/DNA-binding SARP family transcriptional activator